MKTALQIGLAVGVSCGCAQAAPSAPFFQGKTINMVIAISAGSPTDTEGRLVARHLPQHIPGKPMIVVQNMPGAGGVIGVTCGRRLGKHFLTLMQHWSGAVTCPASHDGFCVKY